MKYPNLSIEATYTGLVAGIDEAGRGPWAGPVVAAAVIFPNRRKVPRGIDDSKKLTRAKREELFSRIQDTACCGVGIASVEEIDTHNVWGATKLAMQRAVALLSNIPDVALVDGNLCPGLSCKSILIVEGDAKSISIGAASILAKVTRDRIMYELAKEHPGYGWETNVGYGTPGHRTALKTLGLTPHHRMRFESVRLVVNQLELFVA
jgi:ribonuclease HII